MASHVRRFFHNLHWFVDQTEFKKETDNRKEGRRLVLEAIEAGDNSFLIFLVTGLGWFTDSFILFASNSITPALAFVYWNKANEASYDLALNLATLGGCVIGQLLFGWLADRVGRRKVYGWELLVLMAGTTGVLMSSPGYAFPSTSEVRQPEEVDWTAEGSMNVVAWLIWWRFVTGVGIGGDYPLSATLVSEMAPTRLRARLLAAMFSMQAVGYAAANVVSLVVVLIVRSRHPDASPRSVDQIWRWTIGLSLIPAFIASLLRLTIPESPRYTLDVTDNIIKAFDESNRFKNANLQPKWDELDASHPTNGPQRRGNEPEWVRVANLNTTGTVSSHEDEDEGSKVDEHVLIDVVDINQSKIPGRRYFVEDGNWRLLLGTALSWFLLDIGFYALSLNSPRLVSKLWYQNNASHTNRPLWDTNPDVGDPEAGIYTILLTNSTHSLLISSIGAVIGSIVMIYFIDKINRRKFQIGSFLVLAALFVITGATFSFTIQTDFHGVTVTLFALCVFVFYCGPNTLTFVIPAELFLTKYRATCHGVSAAAGKVGSIITQVFLAYVKFNDDGTGEANSLDSRSKWLGWVLLIFALPMILGAVVTWLLIPDGQHSDRQNKKLEELAFIRQSRAYAPQENGIEMNRSSRS